MVHVYTVLWKALLLHYSFLTNTLKKKTFMFIALDSVYCVCISVLKPILNGWWTLLGLASLYYTELLSFRIVYAELRELNRKRLVFYSGWGWLTAPEEHTYPADVPQKAAQVLMVPSRAWAAWSSNCLAA